MLNMDEIKRQRDMYRARVELTRMLIDLSDDALEYVWRPIAYAWYWTDGNDQDVITDEDADRINLMAAIAHGSPNAVGYASRVYSAVSAAEDQRGRGANSETP